MSKDPLVSVVVPTLNSEKTIEKCLISVKNQTYTEIELIVVDADSTDRTAEIADKYCDKIYNTPLRSRTYQTNFGAWKSDGTYIYRLDSDIVLSNTMIQECVEKCEKGNCDAVATYWGPDPSISIWSRVRKFEKDCYKYDPRRNVSRFYKKEVFVEIGGYNESLVYGEDYDIQNRLVNNNYNTCFTESEGIHLGEPENLKDIIYEQYYYGKTINSFLQENKSQGLVQVSPLRMSFLLNWKKFLKNPLLTIAFIFYELVYYSSTIVGCIIYGLKGRITPK